MQISEVIKNKSVQTASAAVIGFVGGSALGYILGRRHKQQEKEYAERISKGLEIIEQEKKKLQKQKEYAKVINEGIVVLEPDQPYSTLPNEEYNKVQDTIEQIVVDEEDSPEVKVFVVENDDWNYEVELAAREREVPYILHQEEFINDEMGYRQETLTYYSGDDIMADTDDTPIYNYQGLMGELKFGHGSKDPNVVYIRNEVIHMEWEILLDTGMFSQEVLGLEIEKDSAPDLFHSVQKFRRE